MFYYEFERVCFIDNWTLRNSHYHKSAIMKFCGHRAGVRGTAVMKFDGHRWGVHGTAVMKFGGHRWGVRGTHMHC